MIWGRGLKFAMTTNYTCNEWVVPRVGGRGLKYRGEGRDGSHHCRPPRRGILASRRKIP